LKYAEGLLKTPQILKALPFLAEITLDANVKTWRLLSLRSKLEKVSIDLNARPVVQSTSFKALNMKNLIKKHKAILRQSLLTAKTCKILTISANTFAKELLNFLFNALDHDVISSLKTFNLNVKSLYGLVYTFQEAASSQFQFPRNSIVKHLTSISLANCSWLPSPIRLEYLENLQILKIKFASQPNWDFSQLAQLGSLKKLKELNFEFIAVTRNCEKLFFNHFTVPKLVESVHFALSGIDWSFVPCVHDNRRKVQLDLAKHYQYLNFYEQWKGLEKLKSLHFSILEPSHQSAASGLAAEFIAMTIKQLTRLEKLSCSHRFPIRREKSNNNLSKSASVSLKDFWKALEPSRNTLKSLEIYISELAFVVPKSFMSIEFPKLERMKFKGVILQVPDSTSVYGLLGFVNELKIKSLKVSDGKLLRAFLEDIKYVPKMVGLNIGLNMGRLDQKIFVDLVKEFIEEVQIEGNLKLRLEGLKTEDEGLREIRKKVLENKSFVGFKMSTVESNILHIQKDRIMKDLD